MIKNVFIFTLLQIYVSGKKYDLRKGKNVIFNVIYRSLCTDKSMFRQASTGTIFKCIYQFSHKQAELWIWVRIRMDPAKYERADK